MDAKIERLQAWGCNTKDALERTLDDEEFYLECLNYIPDDENIQMMIDAIHAGDLHRAFDAAHTLKGVLANVGLTPMYDKIVEIVEPLRAGSADNIEPRIEEFLKLRDKLVELLKD